MHEYHIVEGIVKKITKVAKENGASKITSVSLALGKVSGLEESSVRLYFETISEGTSACGAELAVKTVPGKELYIENIEIEGGNDVGKQKESKSF
ncbi:hydrogenase maturation nickel metallochaperone HypA [Candidatus Omnitrophota bacterium]